MKLAIYGGKKVRDIPFPDYKTIGIEEQKAVQKVLQSGILSKFLGCWHENFYGGHQVRELEKEWSEYYDVKHAIAVNSATSGLYCAVGASGAGPGDEIIVSPYTMSASATAALIYNTIPVFADIEEDYFCLDPKSIEERITDRTKAIIVVDLFGQPYDADSINKIAKKNNLLVIEDAAQAPGVKYKGKFAGTLGDIGVYSLNYHKHIHTGEGCLIVTDDDDLAERMRLIRNHAEVVVGPKGYTNLTNMVGYNYRMTEIEAAIAREQLKKLNGVVNEIQKNVAYITNKLSKIPCLNIPKTREGCEHAYYYHPIKYNVDIGEVPRESFVEAVRAELTPGLLRGDEHLMVSYGYVRPIYFEPIYQQLIAYGDKGCPFKCPWYKGKLNYTKGLCPVCEKMHFEELILHDMMKPPMLEEDLDDLVRAFQKVWENRSELLE